MTEETVQLPNNFNKENRAEAQIVSPDQKNSEEVSGVESYRSGG